MKEALGRAREAAAAAEEKKASEIVILDMRGLSSITDIFVISGVQNERQLKAVADAVEERLGGARRRRLRRDGAGGTPWIVMDLGGVLFHIFMEEERRRFDLERLWGDAPRLPLKARVRKKKAERDQGKGT